MDLADVVIAGVMGTDALGVSTNSTTYQLCDFGPVT